MNKDIDNYKENIIYFFINNNLTIVYNNNIIKDYPIKNGIIELLTIYTKCLLNQIISGNNEYTSVINIYNNHINIIKQLTNDKLIYEYVMNNIINDKDKIIKMINHYINKIK